MIDRKETGMTYSAFLIKYSEIGIKGKNRYVFEEALCVRINENLSRVAEGFKVEREQGRIFLSCPEEFDYDRTVRELKKIFGVWAICPVK